MIYRVLAASEVHLDAIIGNAQAGGHAAHLNGGLIGSAPIRLQAPLGTGAKLAGKTLVVTSVTVDVQPNTNELIVDVIIDGGPDGPQTETQASDSQPGGSAHFITLVNFVLVDGGGA